MLRLKLPRGNFNLAVMKNPEGKNFQKLLRRKQSSAKISKISRNTIKSSKDDIFCHLKIFLKYLLRTFFSSRAVFKSFYPLSFHPLALSGRYLRFPGVLCFWVLFVLLWGKANLPRTLGQHCPAPCPHRLCGAFFVEIDRLPTLQKNFRAKNWRWLWQFNEWPRPRQWIAFPLELGSPRPIRGAKKVSQWVLGVSWP